MSKNANTRTFRGRTLTEALVKAKSEFGSDFNIVNRRDVREPTLFSKFKLGGECLAVELEVEAGPPVKRDRGEAAKKRPPAVDAPAPAQPQPFNPLLRSYTKAQEGAERYDHTARQAMTDAAAPYVNIGETTSGIAGRLDALQKEVEKTSRMNADLRDELRMLVTLSARGGVPAVSPVLLDCYRQLTAAGMTEALARETVEEMYGENPRLSGSAETQSALLRAVARRIPSAGPVLLREEKPTVVALVGASGVGKSTSVVKLAIHFAMTERKSVAVINEDIRRPGADGQINNLGRIFGISVTTACEPAEVADVVRSMAGRDLILIDTGGRSPRDARGIARLAEFLKAAGSHETHLLLSGVSSERTMRDSVRCYHPVGFDRIMLTKLDECLSYGELVNVASDLGEGFSYVTTGPDYTRPIEPADSGVLAELVLGMREMETDETPGCGEDDGA